MSHQTPRSPVRRSALRVGRCAVLVALVTLLILPALQPLLTSDPTCSYGGDFHIWRGVELDHLLRQGYLYPRWAPDMAQGFGYPLFGFAASLSTYLLVGVKGLGLSWGGALNGALALGLLLSALSVYLLVRDWWGSRAGLVSAFAYAWVPYHAYDLFNRSGLAETTAWFLPPLILWALGRSGRGGLGLMVTALGTGALVLTHNAFALIFAPFLLAFALLLGRLEGRRTLAVGLTGLLLGVGLSAFFWLPALGELDYVHSHRLTDAWVFQYEHNFLSLDQLFASSRVTDPSLVNDWPPRALGLGLALVALLPLLGWRRLARSGRWRVVFFLIGLATFCLMTLSVSRPLWDHLPLLPYVQFPWRFLGPAGLCAAVLAGATVVVFETGPVRPARARGALVGAGLVLGLFGANQGWFFPDHCQPPADLSVTGMLKWEQASYTIGTTAGGEYLPIWVERMPGEAGDAPSLAGAYKAGEPPVRLPPETLPTGARVLRAEYGPVSAEIELESPEAFRARYLVFYYPGWRVSVDGQGVPVAPDEPYGLLTFDVPAGRHVIRVRFGSTPLRTAAVALSGGSFVLVLLLALTLHHRQSASQPARAVSAWWGDSRTYWTYFSVALVLFAARFFIARGDTPLRRSRLSDGQLGGVHQVYGVDFGHRWLLLGRDRLSQSIPADEPLEVVLYWRALEPQGRDYGGALTLVDASGRPWSQVGNRSPRWHRPPAPVYAWPADSYALSAYSVDLLPGTPPGDYRLVLATFDKAYPLERLTAYAPDGGTLGPSLDLGVVGVRRPRGPSDAADVPMQSRLGVTMGPLTLAGVDLDRAEAIPGSPMLVTLFWEVAERGELPDWRAHLTLDDEAGIEAIAWDLPPVRADWPTTLWQPGDLWRGQHLLRLPPQLDSGLYTWRLSLYPSSNPASRLPESPVILGQLNIDAPERLWQAPPLQLALNANLDGQARLLGANLEPAPPAPLAPSDALAVTLAWQAQAEMGVSYRVFLHLLGPDGELLTQSDGEPANWLRPTTGWAPGEVVLDQRTLAIPADAPPGQYALLAGLYDPDSQVRLSLPNGGTAIYVTTVAIQAAGQD